MSWAPKDWVNAMAFGHLKNCGRDAERNVWTALLEESAKLRTAFPWLKEELHESGIRAALMVNYAGTLDKASEVFVFKLASVLGHYPTKEEACAHFIRSSQYQKALQFMTEKEVLETLEQRRSNLEIGFQRLSDRV